MQTDSPLPRQPARWLTIGLVFGAHALLLLAWRATREKVPVSEDEPLARIQWIAMLTQSPPPSAPPPRSRPAPAADAASPAPAATRRVPRPAVSPPAPAAVPAPAPVAAPDEPAITVLPPDPFAEPAPAAVTGADAIRKRAMADLGKIDKDLRKQSLNKFSVPDDSPQKRLIAGIESAKRGPAWYEQAQIEEISTGNAAEAGNRRYKIRTALGTYCITYTSNRSGLPEKKYSLCPK